MFLNTYLSTIAFKYCPSLPVTSFYISGSIETEPFYVEVMNHLFFPALIEEGYHSTNPYHNSIHATDVTQAMHCFLQEEKVYH